MTQQLSKERFILAHGFRSFSPAGWGRDGRVNTGRAISKKQESQAHSLATHIHKVQQCTKTVPSVVDLVFIFVSL